MQEKALYCELVVFLNRPMLWYFPKNNFLFRVKQKCKMFEKLHYSRSRSRIPANSRDGTICKNSLRLKAVYRRIATSCSILNVGRGPRGFFWLQWYFRKILRQLKACVCCFSFIQQMIALKQLWKMLFISSISSHILCSVLLFRE